MEVQLFAKCDKWFEYTSNCQFEAIIPEVSGDDKVDLFQLPYKESAGYFKLKTKDGQTIIRFTPYYTNQMAFTANYGSTLLAGHLLCEMS